MTNLNHMICPLCGHDFYCEAAYGRCDACQCMFYARDSQTCNLSRPIGCNLYYTVPTMIGPK